MALRSIVLASVIVVACSGEQPASAADAEMTGNRFFDAAATKIMAFNQGMSRTAANCAVEQMTADGSIGLGEINQMKLEAAGMADNAGRLNEAYEAALKACADK
ncbi:MAG: hypothetical protein DHS20C11_04610 [Lysobacteraceae bacterium]|nr:MAG: hypothetical protein DHS20C11_04610 [Xanthomonadaceae bacterium]